MIPPKLGIEMSMPTTQETLMAAASTVKALLPREFFGSVKLVFERGRYVRASIEQSEIFKSGNR